MTPVLDILVTNAAHAHVIRVHGPWSRPVHTGSV